MSMTRTAMAVTSDRSAVPPRIGVCIAIADPLLARRMMSLLSGDDRLEVSFEINPDRDPDVILADHVPPLPGPSIIIDDGRNDADAQDGDVRAVLPPGINGETLRAAIRIVSAGFMIVHADELPDFSDGTDRFDRLLATQPGEIALTARESEVLGLLAQGASNKAIARALDISVHTAKFHVASVLAKLGARNRSDAIAIGIRRGLVLL
jgi:DNA-binding CsgD family transcriptional regulator